MLRKMFQNTLCLVLVGLLVGVESRNPTFQYDLYEPVQKAKEIIEGFNLGLTIELLIEVLRGISECRIENSTSSSLDSRDSALPLVEEALEYFYPEELTLQALYQDEVFENLSRYMNSSDFKTIHTYLWDEDEEWNDIIELFYNSGWNGEHSVYGYLRELYDFLECDLEIPTGPRTSKVSRSQRKKRSSEEEILSLLEFGSLIELSENCNLTELIVNIINLIAARPDKPFLLLNYITTQVNTNPSIHLLWAKLSEPAKGQSFREFRSLPEFRCVTNHIWLDVLRPTPFVGFLVSLIRELTMIDFDAMRINVIDLIISALEYSIWKTPFPFPSSTELSCPVQP